VSESEAALPATPPAALPAGSKDVLAVEAQELRAVEGAVRGRFNAFGYREVMTPVLEYADVIDRAQEGGLRDAFRMFDDAGRVLVLRPDLTIPIARLAATRMPDHPGAVRVSYLARVFRPPSPGRPRSSEQRQAGIELMGEAGPGGDAEVIALLVGSLRAAGLEGLQVAVGDVSLTAAILDGLGIAAAPREAMRAALGARNFVEWRRLARAAAGDGSRADLLVALPTLRGGRELLDRIDGEIPSAAPACARLRVVLDLLEGHGVADAVVLDLGVLREWRYYSGVVFEAYAPGVGAPVAMGGRYDDLAGRFGRPRPAVGFGITLDVLHQSLLAANGEPAPPRDGVVLVGGLDALAPVATAARAAGLTVIALTSDDPDADALAAADGWRWVARPSGDGFSVLDRTTGRVDDHARLDEVTRSPA